MDTPRTERIEIVLEDVATTSPWRRLATVFAGSQGTRFLQFVARPPDDATTLEDRVAASGSFPVLPQQDLDALEPDEAWGEEARARFDELIAELRRDGWQPTDRGDPWWSLVLDRPALAPSGSADPGAA